MAIQSKKTDTKSSSKKTPVKKKTRRKTTQGSNVKKSIFIVLGVFLMISMVAFGYFLGQQDMLSGQTPIAQTYKTGETASQKKLLEDLSKIKTQNPQAKEALPEKKVSSKVVKTATKPLLKEPVKKEKVTPKIVKNGPKIRLAATVGKPKLVIIIDDVSNARQLKKIQSLHMKITPSIFPPSQRSMTSHTLARGLKHYMIHLPMESGSKQFNKQYKTLKTTFTKEKIIARVKELRVLFPTARYVNNHTGSVFTNDYKGMLTLYTALKKEGFLFVDSRTIASTKVPKIAKEFGDAYVARDIFIDNVHNVKMIHKELRKAVEIAKKKGYAIVIGHPHTVTMKALSRAGSIFKDVELVYIDDLMTI